MANLITDGELRDWIGIDDADDDVRIEPVNAAVTRGIAAWLGRTIAVADSTATARYFHPLNPYKTLIDDCTTVTAVATDAAQDGQYATVWTAGDWFADPVGNVGPAGQTGWPYTAVVACEARLFTCTIRPYVKVTGTWGWEAIPDDVALGARLYGAELFKLHQAPGGVEWAEDGNNPVIRNNRPLRDLLQPYKRTPAADGRFMVA